MTQVNRLYKLSPSDFKYLWEDCKHCYYRKVVHGVLLPSIGIPGVFMKMNGQLQRSVLGKHLKDLHPDLPSGVFQSQETRLESKPIPKGEKTFVKGRLDLLTKLDDGTYGIIDLKITDPKSEDLYKFSKQLHAYKFALENLANGTAPIKISLMGLLIVSPESVVVDAEDFIYHTRPEWVPIKEDMPGFFDFIDEVSSLLEGSIPPPTATCKWCQYRALV